MGFLLKIKILLFLITSQKGSDLQTTVISDTNR